MGGGPVNPQYSTCIQPRYPPPALASVVKIDSATLFNTRKRVIVLRIHRTDPWHEEDKVGHTVTDGTYERSITVTLRRTR
jgi:hypothetical protein